MPLKAERNYLIFTRHEEGDSFNTLAREFQISPQRAHEIYWGVAKDRGLLPTIAEEVANEGIEILPGLDRPAAPEGGDTRRAPKSGFYPTSEDSQMG